MNNLIPITGLLITTGSRYGAFQRCPRLGYLQYEAENGESVRGWEPRTLNIALSTGSYVHQGIEGLLKGNDASEAILSALSTYSDEVEKRGLDADGEGEPNEVVEEQKALIEAQLWGFQRCIMPTLSDEYDLSQALVEEELTAQLDEDVVLASRIDLAAPRKADGRWFLFNWKTTSDAGERFMRRYETDSQLVTETLALRQQKGIDVAGVNVLAIVKGMRVGVDERLVEVRGEGKKPTSRIQRTKLIYGYKCEANPPLQATTLYDWEGTTKKGWKKFKVWEDQELAGYGSPIKYWIDWLDEEVVKQSFVWVPTIYVDQERIERKVRQIVGYEREVRAKRMLLEQGISLDALFVQNEHACQQFGSKCSMWDQCWTAGVAEDPRGSGLYQPRSANHPIEEE